MTNESNAHDHVSINSRILADCQPRNVTETWLGRGVLGGCHSLASSVDPDVCWLPLDKDQNVAGLRQAQEMLEFVCHDPSVKRPEWACYSLAAMPLAYQAAQQVDCPRMSGEHGLRESLQMVGSVLENAPAVRMVCFDNAAAHAWVKELLLGESTNAVVSSVPFFSDLEWESCPESILPRWPYRVALYKGEAIFCINGPLHVIKNAVAALRSPVRQIFFGKFCCSTAQLCEHGVPPASWMGVDTQSVTWLYIYIIK